MDPRQELEKKLQEVYDWYYSQTLPCHVPSDESDAKPDFDGVDTYVVPQVNAHHGPGGGGVIKEGYFQVPQDRYIVSVTYRCEGQYCGWCYNPDGGYGMWCKIIEGGSKAHWRRHYDGLPVHETYSVYWKFTPRP